jgi:hypothetical protein
MSSKKQLQSATESKDQIISVDPVAEEEPKNLLDYLEEIKDFRRGQGKMHTLKTILVIILMATMSGYFGQRATGDFVKKHHDELVEQLKPKNDKLPSYQTIARVMKYLDYSKLTTAFRSWAKTTIELTDEEWAAVDGKAIRGTTKDAGTSQQKYTNLVNIFMVRTGQIMDQGKVNNKSNEIPLVAGLIERLGLTGLIFTADALHCQKKTVKAIVESGNHYVIGVKGNQPKLYKALKKGLENSPQLIQT